jgi:hypothetical protein
MAFTGAVVDCEGASAKIATVEIARGGTVRVRAREEIFKEEELLCWGNYPDPTITDSGTRISGTVEFYCDSGQDFPAVSNTPVAVSITKAPGLEISGDMRIRNVEIELGTDGKMRGTFEFLSGTTYTFDHNPS